MPDSPVLILTFDEDNPPLCITDLRDAIGQLEDRVAELADVCSGSTVNVGFVRMLVEDLQGLALEVVVSATDLADEAVRA